MRLREPFPDLRLLAVLIVISGAARLLIGFGLYKLFGG